MLARLRVHRPGRHRRSPLSRQVVWDRPEVHRPPRLSPLLPALGPTLHLPIPRLRRRVMGRHPHGKQQVEMAMMMDGLIAASVGNLLMVLILSNAKILIVLISVALSMKTWHER